MKAPANRLWALVLVLLSAAAAVLAVALAGQVPAGQSPAGEPARVCPPGWPLLAMDGSGARCYRPATRPGGVLWTAKEPCTRVYTGDVNADGRLEVVAAGPAGVCVYDGEGKVLSRFTVEGELTDLGGLCRLGGEGESILVCARQGDSIEVRAYDWRGKMRQRFAKKGADDCGGAVCGLIGPDKAGKSKLVVWFGSAYSGALRGVSLFDTATGAELKHFRLGVSQGNLCLGDLAGDGTVQMLVASGGPANGMTGEDGANDSASYVWCFDSGLDKRWRRGPFNEGGFYDSAVLLADINHDGKPEILATPTSHGWRDFQGQVGRVVMLDPAGGRTVAGFDRDFGQPIRLAAAGGLKGDGSVQLLAVLEDRGARAFFVMALEAAEGFPTWKQYPCGPARPAIHALADLDGGGLPSVILSDGPNLRVLNADLTPRWTWRRPDRQDAEIIHVIVSDLRGEGRSRLLVVSGQGQNARLDVLACPPAGQGPGKTAPAPGSLAVKAGQRLTIKATGRWTSGSWTGGPDGHSDMGSGGYLCHKAHCYSLVARIGEGEPFAVGSCFTGVAPAGGTLRFTMNDVPDSFADNSGQLTVEVTCADVDAAPPKPVTLTVQADSLWPTGSE